jgi:ribonuclease VapC
MVIDSSAVLAVLLQQPEAAAITLKIEASAIRLMSAANALETAIVIESRRGSLGARHFDLFLHDGQIDIVPATQDHFNLARDAWRRYGKGRHPAALNICDCLAYALSKSSGEPLLFVGDDFTKTDVAIA